MAHSICVKGLYGTLVGYLWQALGNLNNGLTNTGLSCANANNGLTNANWNIGGRHSGLSILM